MTLLTAVCGWLVPGGAYAQEKHVPDAIVQDETCPDLHVRPGESLRMDCAFSAGFGDTFEWTSADPATLGFIGELDIGAPSFHAPEDVNEARTFTYYRIQRGAGGAIIGRTAVRVVIYPEWTEDCRSLDGLPLKGQARSACQEASTGAARALDARPFQSGDVDRASVLALGQERYEEPLDLRCVQSVTVEAAGESIVSCTSESSVGDLLQYTARFDWPPYSETVVLEGGDLEYTVRAPAITDASAVRRLELTAEDPLTGLAASQEIEVHVVNSGPALHCYDLVVQEGDRVRIPCRASGSPSVRYQILHAAHLGGVPGGILEETPTFIAPEVDEDTTLAVVVRALDQVAGRVVQQEISVMVRDAGGLAGGAPLDLAIECVPAISEVFEGAPNIRIECTITSGQDGEFVWTWAAEGDTPLELLLPTFDPYAPRTATFETPESVDEDTFYEYSVTASHNDLGVSNRFSIFITVLERPDIVVTCQDARARTGDPPLQLDCTATNEKDLPLDYTWDWRGPLQLLRAVDLAATGRPQFVVPGDQDGLFVDYEYTVTASAENADPPAAPTPLTVTVEKILGTLALSCVTPVEVYEGAGSLPLDCTIAGALPGAEIAWTWQPQAGAPDLLTANADPTRGPIFQVPASVPSDQTYAYAISIAAPNYIASEAQLVTINVLTRPELALNCESKVTVFAGDPPRRLFCEVSNDRGIELDYRWEWTPETRLEDADTATPRFNVPVEQREASVEYPYLVSVSAPEAIPANAPVEVTVLNPDASRAFQVAVSTTAMNLGTLGAAGAARMDPDTERLFGLVHGGAARAGRMLVSARDSLSLTLELVRPAVLHRSEAGTGAATPLVFVPAWSYEESCATLAPQMLAESYVRLELRSDDCRLLRFGGEVDLSGAAPGIYTGEIIVMLTIGSLDEPYSVPVRLVVEDARRVVTVGPEGARFGEEAVPSASLSPAQAVRIHPLVAALAADDTEGVLDVSNPSAVPLEISVEAEFGYLEAQPAAAFTPGGGSVVVTDLSRSPLGNLAARLTLHPKVFLLLPGQTRQVRYAIDPAMRGRMADRGYAAMFSVAASPRQYVSGNSLTASVSGSGAARVSVRIPAVYTAGERSAELSAVLESILNSPLEGQIATLLIETAGEPFAGEVVVRGAGGEQLGRSDLLVFTQSRVRVPLSERPGASVTLQFLPGASVPAPASIRLQALP